MHEREEIIQRNNKILRQGLLRWQITPHSQRVMKELNQILLDDVRWTGSGLEIKTTIRGKEKIILNFKHTPGPGVTIKAYDSGILYASEKQNFFIRNSKIISLKLTD